MKATAYQRGHLIEYDFETKRWHYADDGSPITIDRPCVKYGRVATPEGYDACVGYIPNIQAACCGHGVEKPYTMELV